MALTVPTRPRYEHRQTGWAMLSVALLPFVVFTIVRQVAPIGGDRIPMLVLPGVALLGVVIVLGFSSLNVTVTSTHVAFRFGIGVYSRSIALDQIHRVTVVRTRFIDGWGIRFTRAGMLYNVGGFDAVRLDLHGGKTVRIGSDEADRLKVAIQLAMDRLRARG